MSKTIDACPTDMVEAPIDLVWSMLTDFANWGSFYDVRVKSVEPPGSAIVGQRMRGESGTRFLHLGVQFEFTRIDHEQLQLEIDIRMPLGIKVHESLSCVVVDPKRCRVNYHCHFRLPEGWRGFLIRLFLGREFHAGPADSLQRLKRAAEERFRNSSAK